MHLLIPHASALGPEHERALRELELPHLGALLARLQRDPEPLGSDEYDPIAPHERALAQARGWREERDGPAPLAAWRLREAGHDDRGLAWARLSPLHLVVGSDQVTALDPASLALSDAESRAFFEALAPLFPADEGWQQLWLSPTEWMVAHEQLQGLPCASLERVIHRAVDPWMPEPRLLRRLQNEVQMLLHGHALNGAREARRLPLLNSVWISGCGRAVGGALPQDLTLLEGLRAPMLASDLAAWALAWRELDAGPLRDALARVKRGEPLRLTLCGERLARSWHSRPLGLLQRWLQSLRGAGQAPAAELEAL